ncbi:hypothetical protein OUZ56_029558 [Daphnia magna]|uniref:Uncharacterized protein n=1 Tax=Daphnia magna TaxID=35525 RepID=A0ABR0B765_9CRUS|nr:hypothetical protein OUZ56_029558 [Daphnia magna]
MPKGLLGNETRLRNIIDLPDFLLHLPITWAQQYYVYQDSYYFGKLSCFLKNIFNGVVKAKGGLSYYFQMF